MHRIELPDLTPDDGIRLKNLLISAGLTQDRDFVWQYRSAVHNTDGYTLVTFDFEDGAVATYWRLKWI